MTNPIEIKFGDIHSLEGDINRRYVIVDVGEKNYFICCEIVRDENRLGVAGTGGRSDIYEIVGSMSIEEIIKGMEKTLDGMPKKIIDELEKSSKKPPRLIS